MSLALDSWSKFYRCQTQGCWALRNLAANNGRNKLAMAETGAIDAALRCADAPAAVSEQAAAAIGNIATNASNRQAATDAGGIVEVICMHTSPMMCGNVIVSHIIDSMD